MILPVPHRAFVQLPEAEALQDRPSLRRQAWSRGLQPQRGTPPVARQSRFHGGTGKIGFLVNAKIHLLPNAFKQAKKQNL